MTAHVPDAPTFRVFDDATRTLVRVSASMCGGSEAQAREALAAAAADGTPAVWIEEVLLQSYLFAGLPRTLNAMREWRRISGRAAPVDDAEARLDAAAGWRTRGEATCATVYGAFYAKLRQNIAHLHPALDEWMIVEGYGKVLGRPALDLARRELCVVAACAVQGQDRQLHSHLHGALHAGASPADVEATLETIAPLVGAGDRERYRLLWRRVQTHEHHG
jgi:4-carboxymuconolactone decarboxylase